MTILLSATTALMFQAATQDRPPPRETATLEYIALGLIFFCVITIVLGIVKVHTYPGKIAEARNHPQQKAIEVTSLLGLIAFPLWMLALIWAYSNAVLGKLYREQGAEGTTSGGGKA